MLIMLQESKMLKSMGSTPRQVDRVGVGFFGMTINLYNMTSNGEILYMKKLGVVDINNFVVRAMAIQLHLKGRNYVRSNKIKVTKALFFQ